MANSDKHFSRFEPHTRLKHLILETYLPAWGFKLLLRDGAGRQLVFIDACAGTGRDDVGNSGSPVIAARVAAKVMAEVRARKGHPVEILTLAIEKRESYFLELREVLKPFGPAARAIRGELVDHLEILLAEAGQAPVLCFIDPFGVEPLRANVVRAVLDRPQGEVFVLFADQACLRHFGAASAAEAAAAPPAPDLFSSNSIASPDLPVQDVESADALNITAARAGEILDAAFGELDWRKRIADAPTRQRRMAFVRLYEEFLRDSDGRHVLTIPMRNTENQHVYHLIHATRSVHGYVTMKEAVTAALNKSPLGDHATNTMRFAIRSNLTRVVEELLARFPGRTIPWTTQGEDGGPLRDYVLQNTPVFPHEVKALHELLMPYKQPGRAIVYRFPGARLTVAPGQRPGVIR